MKITKNTKGHIYLRESANLLCDKCPVCHESRKLCQGSMVKNPSIMLSGIGPSTHRTFTKGIIHKQTYRVDCYHCYSCGSEWESEPYPWDDNDEREYGNKTW